MGRLLAMAFQPWCDTAEAGRQGSVLCRGEVAVPQPALVPPSRDWPCSGRHGGWLGFPWWKQAAKSINVNHAPLPVFSPISLFFISVGFFILWNQQKRSYFPSVSETPSLFPDFPFHAVWILLRSLYTKAEYWLYDALRDLKGCCHNVTKLWGHFISTRSSLEDSV